MLGKVESGKLDKGEALMLMPNKVTDYMVNERRLFPIKIQRDAFFLC